MHSGQQYAAAAGGGQAGRRLGVRVRRPRGDALPGSFAGRAQELLDLVSGHPQGLAGVFPGSPHAFTALLAQRHEGQVHWRTWHAYPQEGQLVATRTKVGVRVPAMTG
ncbi:hypothetical protein SHKM778_02290 [Streptomyces sp. KM77-8]|uniref:DUF2617 family protein n=1 Tax=Streptomyces haneummycinicus TaxID=3074435 RepID=A0AAT9H8X0_9ACTN